MILPRVTRNVDALRTYDMDIRKILSDNSLKDMMREEESPAVPALRTRLRRWVHRISGRSDAAAAMLMFVEPEGRALYQELQGDAAAAFSALQAYRNSRDLTWLKLLRIVFAVDPTVGEPPSRRRSVTHRNAAAWENWLRERQSRNGD